MTEKRPHVYVVQGQKERDYSDCVEALAHVPARVTVLPFMRDEREMIGRMRDADALVVSFSPVTRGLMSSLEGLKTVVRTGVGYDVIDVPAATELGVIVVNIPDIWVREVANHALALLLAWNRKLIGLDAQVRAGVWAGGIPGERTGALHGETVGIVGDVAIIHARTTYTLPDGREGAGRYTDGWAKRDGRWLAIFAHVTRC